MTEIKMKRVYDDYDPNDGYRILVDRLWPRGMKKESLKFDLWDKDISPSSELRKWYHSDMKNNWARFVAAYSTELEHSPALSQLVENIKQYKYKCVTLLYAAKDKNQNHAIILKKELEKKLLEKI